MCPASSCSAARASTFCQSDSFCSCCTSGTSAWDITLALMLLLSLHMRSSTAAVLLLRAA
jgi:hypothetical protein